jgi:hypothetical protein
MNLRWELIGRAGLTEHKFSKVMQNIQKSV